MRPMHRAPWLKHRAPRLKHRKLTQALSTATKLWLKHRTLTLILSTSTQAPIIATDAPITVTQALRTVTQAQKTDPSTDYCDVTVTQAPNTHSNTEHFDSSTVTAIYALSTVTEAVILSTFVRVVPSSNHAETLNTARFLYLSSVLPGKFRERKWNDAQAIHCWLVHCHSMTDCVAQ